MCQKPDTISTGKQTRITISQGSFLHTSVHQQGPQLAEIGPDSRLVAHKFFCVFKLLHYLN